MAITDCQVDQALKICLKTKAPSVKFVHLIFMSPRNQTVACHEMLAYFLYFPEHQENWNRQINVD